MELIRFIFSSFYIWAGFTILIIGSLNGIAEIISAIRGKNVYNIDLRDKKETK